MSMSLKQNRVLCCDIIVASLFIFPLLTGGCATAPTSSTTSTAKPAGETKGTVISTEVLSPQEQISKLQDKVQELETRLSALNEKINLQYGASTPATPATASTINEINGLPANPTSANAAKDIPTQMVQSHPTDVNPTRPKKVAIKAAAKKYANTAPSSEAVDRFREAKILYDSKRYADSMLEFSDFVKSEPAHALAPAAQYFVGMSYYKQKEYKLAEEELSRGLIAYPHSDYTPDYLVGLAEVSESLDKPERVLYFKQKLLSNFPNSPQAKGISLEKKSVSSKPPIEPVEKIRMPEEPTPPSTPTEPSVVMDGKNE